MHLASEPGDHRAVVPTELPVRHEHLRTARVGHVLDHVPEAPVLRHTASEEDLPLADVGHGALGDLGQHGERGLLDGERDVLQRDPFLVERYGGGYHAGERDVHPLDRIGELMVLRALAGELLEHRTCVESHAEVPAELVQHVADAYVLRLPEYPVPALGVGDDLRVPAGCVEQGGVGAAGERASDLDVGDAVVDADDRHPEGAGERPGGGGRHPEAGTESGAHGERDEVYVRRLHAGMVQRGGDRLSGHLGVMVGGLAGMQPALRGAEHVDLVGEDVALGVNYPNAQRMGGPFDP